MPDPFVLEDMKLATSKIIDYKTKKKKLGFLVTMMLMVLFQLQC